MKYQKELTNKLRTDIIYPITVLNAIRLTDQGEGLLTDLLNDKVDKDGAKVLSTNDYTTAEKTKLFGIEAGADVNQNAFSVIKVTGQPDVRAEHVTENLTFIAGSNVTLTTNPVNKTVSIAATGNSGIYVGADEPTDPDVNVWLDVDGEPDTIQASAVTNTPSGNISSTTVQGAINELDNEKVDKVTGKGLSTNDYTTIEKSKVSNLPNDTNASLANKVDKVTGKSLVSDTAITDLTDGNETTLHKHSAPNITNTPSGGISSNTVQGAINELDTEKADKLFATNLVTNGDFSNGTTGWTPSASVLSVANNTLYVSGDGFQNYPRVSKGVGINAKNNTVYYVSGRFKITNNVCTRAEFVFDTSSSGGFIITQNTPTMGTWYNASQKVTWNQGNENQELTIRFRHYYADATTANGKIMEVQYVNAINLTQIFGAGNEPTKEQMDRLLSIYPNSWFDGTAEITNIKQVFNEKADKLFATNLVTNGDFSNGTTGWIAEPGSNLAVVNSKAEVTITELGLSRGILQNTNNVSIVGNKYYLKANITPKSSNTTRLRYGATSSEAIYPTANMDNKISTIITATGVSANIVVQHDANINYLLGDKIIIDDIMAINLTALFGAGKEPTKEQMDRLLSIYPNSWFDGTAEITNIKQVFNEKADRLFATNLVTNGDFSNGTTGWTSTYGVGSVASNVYSHTGDGTNASPFVYQSHSIIAGRKYYGKAVVKVTNSVCQNIRIRFGAGVGDINITTPTQDTEYAKSIVFTSGITSTVGDSFTNTYADASIANGKVLQIKYVLLLDLTALFGAGKEPTKEQVDWLLAQKYTNSWFDGTKELTSITDLLTLVNTKANITQEAWITPTLLNGYISTGGTTAQYMKDAMGFVHIKGLVTSGSAGLIFTLPVGYRPSGLTGLVSSANGGFVRLNIETNGNVNVTGVAYTLIYLDIITFKAV